VDYRLKFISGFTGELKVRAGNIINALMEFKKKDQNITKKDFVIIKKSVFNTEYVIIKHVAGRYV